MSGVRGVSLEECPPRWATPASDRPNRLPELRTLAKLLGYTLHPWQELVLGVMSEHEDGRPWYRDALVTVPRQCGKSEIVLGLMLLDRLLLWGSQPQNVLWNAQTLPDAIRLFSQKLYPRLEGSPLQREYGLQYASSVANPFLKSKTLRSTCTIAGGSDKAGHGLTLGLILGDEVWAYKDDAREVALRPTMRAVEDPQFILASTAGDSTSFYLRDKVEAGRKRVEEGAKTRTAYFEWSASDDADWQNPSVWKSAIPSWGWTVFEETLAHELDSSSEGVFKRNSLNMWIDTVEEPPFAWEFFDKAVGRKAVSPTGPVVLAVDANPNRDHAVVVAAGDGGVVEVLEERANVFWLEEFLLDVVRSQSDVVGVAAARKGPVGEIVERLEKQGVRVFWYDVQKMADACGYVYDQFVHERLAVVNARPSLRQAVAGVDRREMSGQSWLWKRRPDAPSIASLWAVTLASHASNEVRLAPMPAVRWLDGGKLRGTGVESGDDSQRKFEEGVKRRAAIYEKYRR